MSDYSINLELPDYLRQWLIHEHGGQTPIAFPRLSTENRILWLELIKTPFFHRPDFATDTTVAINIPNFRDKPPRTYHYLSVKSRKRLVSCIRDRFVVEVWTDLRHNGYIGKRKQDKIYDWMEVHGIERSEKNWNAIAKIMLRQQIYYNAEKRKQKKFKK